MGEQQVLFIDNICCEASYYKELGETRACLERMPIIDGALIKNNY